MRSWWCGQKVFTLWRTMGLHGFNVWSHFLFGLAGCELRNLEKVSWFERKRKRKITQTLHDEQWEELDEFKHNHSAFAEQKQRRVSVDLTNHPTHTATSLAAQVTKYNILCFPTLIDISGFLLYMRFFFLTNTHTIFVLCRSNFGKTYFGVSVFTVFLLFFNTVII